MSCQEYKGYKWQCLTTQSPTQQHSEPSQILCGPSDGSPPQPRGRTRDGAGQGGGGVCALGSRIELVPTLADYIVLHDLNRAAALVPERLTDRVSVRKQTWKEAGRCGGVGIAIVAPCVQPQETQDNLRIHPLFRSTLMGWQPSPHTGEIEGARGRDTATTKVKMTEGFIKGALVPAPCAKSNSLPCKFSCFTIPTPLWFQPIPSLAPHPDFKEHLVS